MIPDGPIVLLSPAENPVEAGFSSWVIEDSTSDGSPIGLCWERVVNPPPSTRPPGRMINLWTLFPLSCDNSVILGEETEAGGFETCVGCCISGLEDRNDDSSEVVWVCRRLPWGGKNEGHKATQT